MPKLPDKAIKKGMRYSIRDGAAAAVRNSVVSNYTIPFALALGATNELIGLVTAVPILGAGILAPFVGKIVDWVRDRKRLCSTMWLFAHLFLIPAALIPIFFLEGGVWWLILFLTIAHVFRSVGSTTWATWMGDLIPIDVRGRFFGKRNMVASGMAFLATLGAGWALGIFEGLNGFMMLFTMSVLFGLLSYSFLVKVPYAKERGRHGKLRFKFSEMFAPLKKNKELRNFALMSGSFNFAIFLAAPFFAVYMLREMGIGYEWFAAVVAIQVLITVIAQPYWGKLADRFGDRAIMATGAILTVFVPMLWLFVNEAWHIIPVVVVAGFGWAAYSLTRFNYMLDITPVKHRPIYIENYKILAVAPLVAGPIVGGVLANIFQSTTFLWLTGLQIVFLVSFLLRGAAIGLLMPRLKEARVKRKRRIRHLFWKVVAIYPVHGLAHEFSTALRVLHKVEHKVAKREKKLFDRLKVWLLGPPLK